MIINHNMNALNAHRNMGVNNTAAGKSMEKLSSGLRINRAGDDAAGLAISEKMRGQIRGLEQSSRNSSDGISMIQTAEGALNETTNILQRMRELAVQSANDTNTSDDREQLQKEMTQLGQEIDRIANNTEFNTKKLLNGDMGKATTAAKGILINESSLDKTTQQGNDLTALKDANGNLLGISKDDTITATWSVNGTQQTVSIKVTDKQANAAGEAKTLENLFQKIAGNSTINAMELDGTNIKITSANTGIRSQINGFSIEVKSASGERKEAASNALSAFKTETQAADTRTNGSANLQIGANSGQQLNLSIEDMSAVSLGVSNLQVGTQSQANTAINVIDEATKKVSSERANLGAAQNRLEYTISNLDNTAENLTSAESTLRDVDMAKEMMEYSKNNILNQAAQAMISQANQQPQNVLQLLR